MRGWLPTATGDGSFTLAHPVHGETCHSRDGAWREARERYAAGCALRERAAEVRAEGGTTLCLLDIGTGLGLNLAAALEALDGSGVSLEATSLEIDGDVIARTLELARERALGDAFLERHHAPVRAALTAALVASGGAVPLGAGSLRLLLGDGRETLESLPCDARFDAVFLDPFSPARDSTLWELAFLGAVARRMHPRAILSTYSASALVRARLQAAGLATGPGGRVGTKAQGTLASRARPLPPWPARVERKLARRARAILGAGPDPVGRFPTQGGHSRPSML